HFPANAINWSVENSRAGVSVGGVLSRAALGGFLNAAREIKEQGTFTFAEDVPSHGELNASFGD
ncbi:MAG: hypothetical protein HQ511_11620, partial [Rhodospirillales bacterium]|nr:hypothetical protein [Rhodospirillales bacterium]